jgi:short-subunit dehydrogenase
VLLGPDTRALVTGSSRGIGRSVALELARRHATVGLLARNADDLACVADEVAARGGRPLPLIADVADRAAVEEAVGELTGQAGGLDLVVANAAVAHYAPFRAAPIEEAEDMTRTNWLGTVYTVGATLPILTDQARGHLAIVSSAAGFRAFPWAAVYGATKFAQRGFAEALRHELSGTGVGVTCIYPGEVKTHLHDEARARGTMPDWRRPGAEISPERVAKAIVEGVEQEKRSVFVPAVTRLLGIVHGVSPAAADRMLRFVAGATAAPAKGR